MFCYCLARLMYNCYYLFFYSICQILLFGSIFDNLTALKTHARFYQWAYWSFKNTLIELWNSHFQGSGAFNFKKFFPLGANHGGAPWDAPPPPKHINVPTPLSCSPIIFSFFAKISFCSYCLVDRTLACKRLMNALCRPYNCFSFVILHDI